ALCAEDRLCTPYRIRVARRLEWKDSPARRVRPIHRDDAGTTGFRRVGSAIERRGAVYEHHRKRNGATLLPLSISRKPRTAGVAGIPVFVQYPLQGSVRAAMELDDRAGSRFPDRSAAFL